MTAIEKDNRNFKVQKLISFIFYVSFFYIFVSFILLFIVAIVYPEYLKDLQNMKDWPTYILVHINSMLNFYLYLILSVGLIVILWGYYRQEWAIFKHKATRNIGVAVSFYFIGLMGLSILSIILEATGLGVERSQNQEVIDMAMKSYAHYMIPPLLLAPLVEETIFRGIIYKFFENLKLPNRWNTILAFAASILIFAFIHVSAELTSDPLTALHAVLPYLVMGTCFTVVYYMTKSLYAAMITHFLQNFMSVILTFLLMWLEIPGSETSMVTHMLGFLQNLFLPFL